MQYFTYHKDTQHAGHAIGNWLSANAPHAKHVSTTLDGDFWTEIYLV